MATLEEKWKKWLEEQEKERGNLIPFSFSSEELEQLLETGSGYIGHRSTANKATTTNIATSSQGSIAATPYQRMAQSLDEALLPEQIREDYRKVNTTEARHMRLCQSGGQSKRSIRRRRGNSLTAYPWVQ